MHVEGIPFIHAWRVTSSTNCRCRQAGPSLDLVDGDRYPSCEMPLHSFIGSKFTINSD